MALFSLIPFLRLNSLLLFEVDMHSLISEPLYSLFLQWNILIPREALLNHSSQF